MMKGLLYKQLVLSRKSLLLSVSMLAVFLLAEALVLVSLRAGNLARFEDAVEIEEALYNLFLLLATAMAFGSCVSDHDAVASDYGCKWNMFSYTIPVKAETIALAKILWMAGGYFIGGVVAFANYLVLLMSSGRAFDINEVWMMFGIGLFVAISECIRVPLVYRFKSSAVANGIVLGIMCVVTIVLAIAVNVYDLPDLSPDVIAEILDDVISTVGFALPLVTIAAFVVSYIATVGAIKRKVI